MSTNSENELIDARKRLLEFAESYDAAPETDVLNAIAQRAGEVGKSASGSWLGYQANVYYRDFVAPRAGVHFNVEYGTGGTYFAGPNPDWIEHTVQDVIDCLVDNNGKAALELAETRADTGLALVNGVKSDVSSVLTLFLGDHDDSFVRRLAEEIEKSKILDASSIANEMSPKRQLMTRDMRAAQQGTWAPPHVSVQARVIAAHQPAAHCRDLAERIEKLAAHMSRSRQRDARVARIGTNVFIGHGRSPVWKDLKDFVKDRLHLPHDEFNRVPVAGITNIARLSETLDAAACAFVIMTAEDETADGKVQARMNVIHEVGLFQGRLGFTKAIVLLEEGCEEFSNIQGLGQIRFPKGNVSAKFEEIRQVLEREGVLEASR